MDTQYDDKPEYEVINMVVQCCVCKKVRKEKQWVDTRDTFTSSRRVSHGYCPHCAEAAFDELRQLMAASKGIHSAA